MGNIHLHNYEAYLIDYFDGTLSDEKVRELREFLVLHPELDIDLSEMDLPVLPAEHNLADFKNDLLKSDEVQSERLIAAFEGQLNPQALEALHSELHNNPLLQKEWERIQKTRLHPEPIGESGLEALLLKTEDDLVLTNRLIAYFENQLGVEEQLALEAELKTNATLRKELDLLKATRLTADAAVTFENKESLMKEAVVVSLFSFKSLYRVAAAILLLFGLFLLIRPSNDSSSVIPQGQLAQKPAADEHNTDKKNTDAIVKVSEPRMQTPANTLQQKANTAVRLDLDSTEKTNTPVEEAMQPFMAENNRDTEQSKDSLSGTNDPGITLAATNNPGTATITTNNNTGEPLTTMAGAADAGTSNYLVAYNDEDETETTNEEKGLWKTVTRLAKKATQLGVKGIELDERPRKGFSLSFNSFSVEKK
mgnify:CR=1 FL=1